MRRALPVLVGLSVFVALLAAAALPCARAAAAADPRDVLRAALPAGWQREVEVLPHARHWRFWPAAAVEPGASDEGERRHVQLEVQLDVPQREFSAADPRATADAIFAFKQKVYADQGEELEPGPVAAARVAGLDGFARTYARAGGITEETFVAAVDRRVLIVNLAFRSAEDAVLAAAARALRESLSIDRGADLLLEPTESFHDSEAACALVLPSSWAAREERSSSSRTLIVSPAEGDAAAADASVEVMIWPRYSKSAPSELSGTDEKAREGWTAAAAFVTQQGMKVVALPIVPATISGVLGNRVEVSRAPEGATGTVRHRLHFIAAVDDTLLDVEFEAPELSWPRFEPVFERALAGLELNLGKDAVHPDVPNSAAGRHGDALLLADRLAAAIPAGYIRVLDPAPGSAAGWQTEDDKRRIMLTSRGAKSAQEFIANYRAQIPKDWGTTELERKDLAPHAAEIRFTTELPNGKTPLTRMAAVAVGRDRVLWLNAVLDPDDAEGMAALDPVFAAFVAERPLLEIAGDRKTTFSAPGLRVRFAPPKSWEDRYQRSRAVVSFEHDTGTVALEVRPIEATPCPRHAAEAIEQRMAARTREGKLETLAEKKLSGGKGGQDVERTTLLTAPSGKRLWTRTRVLHRCGHSVALIFEIPLRTGEKPAAAEGRAAPVLASLQVDAGGK